MSRPRSARGSNARTQIRKQAQKAGVRSGFELRIVEDLEARGVEYEYEPKDSCVTWTPKTRKYLPDFRLANGILVEAKGRLTGDDRVKLLAVREQHPDIDLRIVFMYPNNKLGPKSKTRYYQWADKHGFKWAEGGIPNEWVEE